MTRTHWPKDALIPDLSLEVADTGQEAVLLQGAGLPSPLRVEEVVSDAPEEGLPISCRFKHKRFISGFLAAGGSPLSRSTST